ncbi:chloroplast sensor kinase, chloroplastic isoform X1 [Amborella trichopoda]|uniref:Histidine kinase/HSP90-like ATPase domain-containing protein n=1 Tax=Amborella trichopoda TaxID=13333 RepID=W1PUZ4_AMBTC|nr:chloroplast sensor kinase, chloroplastic isoform X1 [Amborella trichopoda]ERN13842.1 hypothetical protein AMTR_s00049p00226280 [Amborella trichopoda]|eukprot:XP_006852375.1 chloroplast sensor kinase, chloroplastic isoform X1 [Amborella trichopoda]
MALSAINPFSSPFKSLIHAPHSCGNNSLNNLRLLINPRASNHRGSSGIKVGEGALEKGANPRQAQSYVTHEDSEDEGLIASAMAAASVIRKASKSPVEFIQRTEKPSKNELMVSPSEDFQRLCIEQLGLFRRIVGRDVVLSVYVRPAGSYVMERLELHRVMLYPKMNLDEKADIVVIIGTFGLPSGLQTAEAALSNQQVEEIPECRAFVLPMMKDPFLVGLLVAEFPVMELGTYVAEHTYDSQLSIGSPNEETDGLPLWTDENRLEVGPFDKDSVRGFHLFTAEQISAAVGVSRSLAVAYVMDQKAVLLQQSSWQHNVRMSNLIEQIRDSLSSIRILGNMLSVQLKKSEISYDVVEDILVQGDRMKDTLKQLQDAVYLTKANIVRFNEDMLSKVQRIHSNFGHPEIGYSYSGDILSSNSTDHASKKKGMDYTFPPSSELKDFEIPMPPLALAALQQHKIRPCNVSKVLAELVGAADLLVKMQQRSLLLREFSMPLEAAIEESALHQALSNLVEGALLRTQVGGKVEIIAIEAPGGGVLIVLDDDGPDMHYMTQMHSLAPFGAELSSVGKVEDSITWNFVAGLTVAREILESYGSVVRVTSPRLPNAILGAGGTRIELWLPAVPSDFTGFSRPEKQQDA